MEQKNGNVRYSFSTPAIDENENIYVSATFKGLVRDHRLGYTEEYFVMKSKLFCYDSDGRFKSDGRFFPLNPETGEENYEPQLKIH